MEFPRWLRGKESACQCRRCRRHRFGLWSWKWHPTPVFLPGESHGQRSLAVYSPWGLKESDTTEHITHTHTHTQVTVILFLSKNKTLSTFYNNLPEHRLAGALLGRGFSWKPQICLLAPRGIQPSVFVNQLGYLQWYLPFQCPLLLLWLTPGRHSMKTNASSGMPGSSAEGLLFDLCCGVMAVHFSGLWALLPLSEVCGKRLILEAVR